MAVDTTTQCPAQLSLIFLTVNLSSPVFKPLLSRLASGHLLLLIDSLQGTGMGTMKME